VADNTPAGSPPLLTLSEILDATGGRLLGSADANLPVHGAATDSRRIRSGELFAAQRGAKHDGHDFVTDAFARGAAAALVTRVPPDCPWVEDPGLEGPPLILVPDVLEALGRTARAWRRRQPARVVVVVGSVARATTRELVAAVLRARGPLLQNEGTRSSASDVPLTLLRLTPRHRYVVLDLDGPGPGELRDLADIAGPDVAVVMNVQGEPLEPPLRLDEIAERYAGVLESLPPEGVAVLNGDDSRVRALRGRAAARALFFGLNPDTQLRATDIAGRGLGGTEFSLRYAGESDRESVHVVLPLVGLQSVHAALAAAAVGLAEGLTLTHVAEELALASSSVRIVVARGINGAQIVDDTYDADPESMLAALNLLAELGGRKVAVLGDMLGLGRGEESAHVKIGSRAARVADLLVTVGPRAASAAAEARRIGLPATAVVEAPDHESAVAELKRRLRPGDAVLVKGSRGMHMEEIVQAIRVEG
jgi:UDP-N-acetylmuramoyl-tripeptide--D-alanyl-D-alanine ligase